MNGSAALWKAASLALIAFLSGLTLAGLPYFTQAPRRGEVDRIAERQQQVLQRLAIIEERLNNHTANGMDLNNRLTALEVLVRQFIENSQP